MHPFLSHRDYLSQSRLAEIARPDAPRRLGGILQSAFDAAARRWRRRRMTAALERLSDRTLADIGIARADITLVVEGFDDRELGMTPLAAASCKETAERSGYVPAS
ncbi:DUF1127 domain-containing protein [Defluviimonas sp. SAOS-178_SWC]|uniref:DUF1127 domain-containing protein n=1 Tax=Defluviimonas sp. SAOS-178_SWC TaxID=3121287 RepID=UPI0032215C23